MPTPNKDYRENPERAIYVLGRINQEMVHALTPKINQLRASSGDPITVYIDSPGGSIPLAETIRCLVKAPSQDGRRCRIITVVTGLAASAAADFLALGDYAVAHPHADVIYHGSRQFAEEVTSEAASFLAASLQETNERFALRLARCSFPRIIWRVMQLDEAFVGYRSGANGLTELVASLEDNFSGINRRLLREALAKQRVIRDLSTSVSKHLKRFKTQITGSKFEAELLKAIINYRTRLHKDDGWLMSKSGMQEVSNDFNLVHDFYYGSQTREVGSLVSVFGRLFLKVEELTEYGSKTPEQQKTFVEERAGQKLKLLWYFVVSLCRLLQTKDYHLTPEEAYWAGVVDEVPGSGLPNERETIESLPVTPTPPAPVA
jgi:ATP-dependent protease ClpP protease subunit